MPVSRVTRRSSLVALTAAVAFSVAGAACVDLFHSTDFTTCKTDDSGACVGVGKPDATSSDGGHIRDGGSKSDGTTPTDAHVADGHVVDSHVADGGHIDDSGHPVDSHVVDTGHDTGVDLGTNFCAFDSAQAASYAAHACLWLGSCAGVGDLNDLGNCYPLALMAYDCALNPNQRVHGSLHAFWDKLKDATQCSTVLDAVYGGATAPESCTGSGPACTVGSPVATTCQGGAITLAVNCGMAGYTCQSGKCQPNQTSCGGTSVGACVGSNTFTACQAVTSADGGTATVYFDVGRDCTNFGAGNCVAVDGSAGCKPEEAGVTCDPSTTATCALDGSAAVGCATGTEEVVRCTEFAAGAKRCTAGTVIASSSALVQACYTPEGQAQVTEDDECAGTGSSTSIQYYTGAPGTLVFPCADAGLNALCLTTGVAGLPSCQAP